MSRRLFPALLTGLLTLTAALTALPAQAADRADLINRYVALGDSYASGEGLAPYEAGTDTDSDRCHRSARQSYPELLEQGRNPAFNRLNSVACSGAQTTSLLARFPTDGEAAQLTALRSTTRTVTLGVGGNDVGFASVLADCIYSPASAPEIQLLIPGRPGCQDRRDGVVTALIDNLAADRGAEASAPRVSLPQVLAEIHRRAPRARIYVSGVPQLLGATRNSPWGCQVGELGPFPLAVTESDTQWIRTKSAQLNGAIAVSVIKARVAGIDAQFVDIASDFEGHNVCDPGTPWLNPVVLDAAGPSPASFHPTARGQRAYAAAFLRATGR